MKPTARDYLAITAALLAILLCGYGIGFLVGERTTRLRLAPAAGQAGADWSTATLDRLTRELELAPAQQAAIKPEIQRAAAAVHATRQGAVHDYRVALIELHQRLLPHLNRKQRRQVEESARQLQSSLDKAGEALNDPNK
jgi:hypothetical protein